MSPHPPISEDTAQRLLTEVLSLKGEVILVKAKTEDTHARLFGNGQPGELATLESKINDHGDWITRADERGKTNRNWTLILATAFSGVVHFVADWISKRHS